LLESLSEDSHFGVCELNARKFVGESARIRSRNTQQRRGQCLILNTNEGLNEILKLSDKDREHVFALLGAFLRDAKAKKVYS
jgi:hypothetical protein